MSDVPFLEVKLKRLDDLDDIPEFLEWLAQPRSVLAIDTETGGIDGAATEWYRDGFQVRLVQFGDNNTGFVMRADRFGAVIEHVLTTYNRPIVGHNFVGFDLHALRAEGFSTPARHLIHDTFAMAKLVDTRGFHGLKYLAEKHVHPRAGEGERGLSEAFARQGLGKNKGVAFSTVSYGTPAYDVYSAVDVVLTARLYEVLWPQIEKEYSEAYYREMGAWFVVTDYERKGLLVNHQHAEDLRDDYEARLADVTDALMQAGISKPGSKIQKVEALQREGWTPEDFTETGEPVLDKQALERIASPTALLLMEHDRLQKWLSAYIYKVLDSSYKGRIFPQTSPFQAKTGRQSMSNPPLQQIPSRHEDAPLLRKLVRAAEGWVFYSIDYSGQENVLLAHFSRDVELTRILTSDGADIHRYTASQIFAVNEEDVTKEQRAQAKTSSYLHSYGGGAGKLAKNLQIPQDEARRILKGLSDAFPQARDWTAEIERQGQRRYDRGEGAWVATLMGRKIWADEIRNPHTGQMVAPAMYPLKNFCLQGSGKDILAWALNRLADADLSQYIAFCVHDEVVLHVPEGPEGLEIAQEVQRLMRYADLRVPLDTGLSGPSTVWEK